LAILAKLVMGAAAANFAKNLFSDAVYTLISAVKRLYHDNKDTQSPWQNWQQFRQFQDWQHSGSTTAHASAHVGGRSVI